MIRPVLIFINPGDKHVSYVLFFTDKCKAKITPYRFQQAFFIHVLLQAILMFCRVNCVVTVQPAYNRLAGFLRHGSPATHDSEQTTWSDAWTTGTT